VNAPVIEPAGPAHAGLLAALHAEAFATGWSEDALRALLVQPHVAACLAVRAGRPAGFILMRTAVAEAEVLTLAVTPDARRRGVGRALLEAGERAAAACGARRFLLEVSAQNQAAVALYEAGGWRVIGVRAQYYADGADAWLMEKNAGGGNP